MKTLWSTITLMVLSLAVHGQTTLLWQDFEGVQGQDPPAGWSIDLIAGQSTLDSFSFGDSLYFLAPPLEGNFALFDSYKGGQLTGTNGNGQGEEVGLCTPWIHDLPSNELFVRFAYHFVRYSQARFFVDAQTDTQSWTTIWSRSTSTVYSQDQELDLNTFSGADSLRIRFRWKNSETLPNQGLLAIDNIHLLHRKPLDIATEIRENLDQDLLQGQAFQPHLEIINQGVDTAYAIPWFVRTSGIQTVTYRDTLSMLLPGERQELQMPAVHLDSNGFLSFDLYSELIDSLPGNDSASISYNVLGKAGVPVLSADTICGPGQSMLYAAQRPGETTIWSDSTDVLGIGSPVLSPHHVDDQVFYGRQSRHADRMVNSYQGAMRRNGNPTGGSYFSIFAKHDLVVDSFMQHCAYQSQSIRVKLYHRNGKYEGYERQQSAWELVNEDTLDAMGWGTYLSIVPNGIFLDSGQWHSFYLTVEGGASPTFHADSFTHSNRDLTLRADAMNPFAFGGILKPYAWNGRVYYKRLDPGQTDSVNAVIHDLPSGSNWVEGRGSEGQFRSGALNDPDITAPGRKMVYEVSAPSGLSWSDHGTKWQVASIDLSADQGHIVADTDTMMNWSSTNGNMEITFIPDAGWVGHHLLMKIRIIFIEGECDTILQRRVRVAPLPELSYSTEPSCQGDTSLFISYSTISSGTIEQWWHFSPTDSVKASAAAYRFTEAGSHPIRLRVVTDQGIEVDSQFLFTVHSRPEARFTAVNACFGEPVQLTNTTVADTSSVTAIWYFEDGDSASGDQVQYAFDTSGSHLVRLVVSTDYCSDQTQARVYQFERPNAEITYEGHCAEHPIALTDISSISDGTALGRKWLLPNSTDLLTNEQVLYIPPGSGWTTIGLVSYSQFSCTDTVYEDIHIDPSPEADFSYAIACDRLPTEFVNVSSIPPGHSNTYLWQMDGQEWTSEQLTYQFEEPGQAELRLIAWATNGCLDTVQKIINIGRQPVADFDHEGQCSGEAVQFVNLTSNTVGSIEFMWRFGDGDSSAEFAPEHMYEVDRDSSFELQLTARASNGCETSEIRTLTIGAIPTCGFNVIRSSSDRQVFTFEPADTTQAQYTWRFGTDGQSFSKRPTHRFTHPDETYDVQLEIETGLECTCQWTEEVTTSWALSVEDLDVPELQLWPNPGAGSFWIRIPNSSANELVSFEVTDMLGKQVWTMEGKGKDHVFHLDLNALPAGQYLLHVRREQMASRMMLQITN